jgi:uncharacterized protein (TIGR00251 family)
MDDSSLEIRRTKGGCSIRVTVRPGGGGNRIKGLHGGALKVEVTAPPAKGKANDAVIRLLSREVGVPRASLKIVRGASTREKSVFFGDMDPDELRDRISRIAGP